VQQNPVTAFCSRAGMKGGSEYIEMNLRRAVGRAVEARLQSAKKGVAAEVIQTSIYDFDMMNIRYEGLIRNDEQVAYEYSSLRQYGRTS
jgi:hypothetical protein